LIELLRGVVVPHAPALLIDSADEEVAGATLRIRAAVDEFQVGQTELLVVVSGHGDSTGVYRNSEGSLEDFGIQGQSIKCSPAPDLAAAVAEAWGKPVLDGALDHGAVVPLNLIGPVIGEVIVATVQETTGHTPGRTKEVITAAKALAAALRQVLAREKAAVVFSAHTAAALNARAPLLERPQGHELDRLILEAFANDLGLIGAISERLWNEAGSCGTGPLTTASVVWSEKSARVLAYEQPAGVGYLVAELDSMAVK
jgi:aromatic ring-opening dioxygenase LigB subunit